MERTEWYRNAVIYQIYPFSFKDSNNDGWGDIPGIISMLDHVKELGVTAIWFSPLYRSPDKDYGYDISDYRDIDPKFGTLEDFKTLVAECHARDIRVIMDMVINHTSTEHEWFKKALADSHSPYRDYYIIREGKKKGGKLCPPTNWESSFTGSAWERIGDSNEYYLHLFCTEQADLNWENEAVRKEAADIFNYWFELGVDGFRLDVFNMFSKVYPIRDAKKQLFGTGYECFVDGPRMHEFLRELNDRSFSRYDSYTVGESYMPHEEDARKYTEKDNRELDTIFNFAHFESDNIGGAKYFKKPFDLVQFKKGLFGPQVENYGKGWNTLVLENHDCARSVSRFGIDTARYRYEAATFLPTVTFLGFGTPFIYMGQEIGMTNTVFRSIDECRDPVSHFIYNLLRKYHVPQKLAFRAIQYGARDHARAPMQWSRGLNAGFNEGAEPWQRMNDNYPEINVEKDLESERSVYRFFQKLLELKKTNQAALYGKPELFDEAHRQVICYTRSLETEGILVFGNFSNKTVKYKLPAQLQDLTKEEILSNFDTHSVNGGTYTLRPYEAIVYSFKK